jgi:hypothetical protein
MERKELCKGSFSGRVVEPQGMKRRSLFSGHVLRRISIPW